MVVFLFICANVPLLLWGARRGATEVGRQPRRGAWRRHKSIGSGLPLIHSFRLDELLSEKSYSLDNLSSEPDRAMITANDHTQSFTYEAVNCPRLMKVNGAHSHFFICSTEDIVRGYHHGDVAYFVGGERDLLFEQNFHAATKHKFRVIFIASAPQPLKKSKLLHELIDDIEVGPFTHDNRTALKDVVDHRFDTTKVEFIKFDLNSKSLLADDHLLFKDLTEAVVSSIYTGIDFCNILISLPISSTAHPYGTLKYLIKRLNHAAYYLYSIVHKEEEDIYHLSFVRRFCILKYKIGDPFKRMWKWK